MDPESLLQISLLFLLIFLSGFFSSTETAYTMVNRIKLRTLAEDGDKRALKALEILEDYPGMISSILIGNNLANIYASSLVTSLTIRFFGNIYIGLTTGLLTMIILIFGEITPKSRAASCSEKMVLSRAYLLKSYIAILRPLVLVVNAMSGALMKLFRMEDSAVSPAMTEDELKTYVDVGHEEGAIETDERKLIYNIFDFNDATAREIMIPRIDMETVEEKTGYSELRELFKSTMYTRIPVYREDPDKIIGLVNIKDFLLVEDTEAFTIDDIIRTAYYTYELKKSSDLLSEMRERSMNVAFVLNEYGGTCGMITMEDLLEELVGEIRDEYDRDEEEMIRQIYDDQYLINAGMKLDDINDALGTSFNSQEADSLGGMLIEGLGRMPKDGDSVNLESGITLKVRGVKDNRITNVLLTLPSEDE